MLIVDTSDHKIDVLSHHFSSSALDNEMLRETFSASERILEAYLNIQQGDLQNFGGTTTTCGFMELTGIRSETM